jgi:hypothetical protein
MPGGIAFIAQFRVLSSLREQEIIYIHKGLVGTL